MVERIEELSPEFPVVPLLIFAFLMNAYPSLAPRLYLGYCVPESPNRGVRFANACARAAVSKQLLLNHSVILFGPAPLHMRSGRGEGEFVLE